MKIQNTKNLACLGLMAILLAGLAAPVTGLTQNQVYATEDNSIDIAESESETDLGDNAEEADEVDEAGSIEEVEPEISEEIYQKAELVVETIRRLEKTPDYQKMARLLRAMNCAEDDNDWSKEYYGCTVATTKDDIIAALLEIEPGLELPEDEALEGFVYGMNFYSFWSMVNLGVTGVYNSLGDLVSQESDDTVDLNVENVAKILQEKDIDIVLSYLFGSLSVLEGNSTASRIVRIRSKFEGDNIWMRLVDAVRFAEGVIGGEYEESADNWLSSLLEQWVGDISEMTLEEKIAAAKDLSDYVQAETLYDEFGKFCAVSTMTECMSVAVMTLEQNYTDEELEVMYEKIFSSAEILVPESLEGLFDYHLVLADLNDGQVDLPTIPNTGFLQNGELTGKLMESVLTGIAVITAVMVGGMITAKRYLFSPLKRRK